ncbi:MAG: murein biosynthesis integral membrane protein MurJ [Gammaproteobacteria bacterium]|nr:murein biosynthesis integral membrane protein MurJ [Gammaproteobacteria bacterium]
MGLLRSASVFSALTLVSRVFGLIRDQIIAIIFGAGAGLDAFWVAFKIPNFMRRLFAEGAFSQGFVPVLGEYKVRQGDAAVRDLIGKVAGSLALVVLLITLVSIVVLPWLILHFGPRVITNQHKLVLTAGMLVLTLPYILFISLTSLAGGVLNTYKRFAIPAFTPVFLNLCMIAAAIWLAPLMPPGNQVKALAWGVLAAGIVQLGFQLPFLARMGLLIWPRWGFNDPGVQRIMRLMGPAILGSMVVQINLMVDLLVAYVVLPDGSVSWLTYSDRLVEFPLGVFGIAISTVILPSLSQHHVQTDGHEFAKTLDWGIRWALLIALPATAGLVMLAGPLMTTLFNYGAFKAHDVLMSQMSLLAYASGLLAFIMIKVLAPAFYSRQDTRTPVRIAVVAMLSNIVLILVLVIPWVQLELPAPHAGLAMATSLSAYGNAIMLFLTLRRQGVYHSMPGWGCFLRQLAGALAMMLAVLIFAVPGLSHWLAWSAGHRALMLLVWVGVCAATYFAGLYLFGFRLGAFRAQHS